MLCKHQSISNNTFVIPESYLDNSSECETQFCVEVHFTSQRYRLHRPPYTCAQDLPINYSYYFNMFHLPCNSHILLLLLLLLLPLALQPTVGFGLSNNVLPFFPICHQLSPSSHSQHLKISNKHAYGQLHTYMRGSPVNIQSPTHCNLIACSMISPPPVLSPSSVLPPPPSHWVFVHAKGGGFVSRFKNIIFLSVRF